MKKNKQKIIILGAGMAGLGASIQLKKLGYETTILEKEAIPGGLFSNNSLMGCDFDYGPKILLLDDEKSRQDMLPFLEGNYNKYPVEEKLYLSKYGLLNFPLQRHLIELPKNERDAIIFEIKQLQKKKHTITNYEDWLISSYGEHLSRQVLIPYEEKKWQMNLKDMDYRWALKRPVKVDIDEVVSGARFHLPANRWYYYPKIGNINTLTEQMTKRAGRVIYKAAVTSINTKQKIITAGGKKYAYDILISTAPINYLVSITKDMPSELSKITKRQLKRLSIWVFNLVYKGNHKLEGTAFYFPEKKYIFRRVSILENLCPALKRVGKTPISVEVSINPDEDQDPKEIYKAVLTGLKEIPQFAKLGNPVGHQSLFIDFAYPLQTRGHTYHIADLHRYYSSVGIFNCGRGGTYNYCNGDEAYRQGADTANRVHELIKNKLPSVGVAIVVTESTEGLINTIESLWHSTNVNKFPVILSCRKSDINPDLVKQMHPFGVKILWSNDDSGPAVLIKKAASAAKTDLLLTTKPGVTFEPNTISRLVQEFTLDPLLTLASPRILSDLPETSLQKSLQAGSDLVDKMSNAWQSGDNYLSVQDKCMCFRIDMLQHIDVSDDLVNCDAYFYFENRRLGGKFKRVESARVSFPLDTQWANYQARVNNFVKSKVELEQYFKLDLKEDYKIPLSISAYTLVKQIQKHPLSTAKYLLTMGISRVKKNNLSTFPHHNI